MLISKYTFNEFQIVSLDLLYSYADSSFEVTKPLKYINKLKRRNKGEFQNRGPSVKHMYTPAKDPAWLYDLK